MLIHQCDRKGCTRRHEQKRGKRAVIPPGWYELSLAGTYGDAQVWYEICDDCRVKLEIPDTCPEQTVGQKLLEVIEDLVTDEVERQTGS